MDRRIEIGEGSNQFVNLGQSQFLTAAQAQSIEDKVRQALGILQDAALFGKSESALVEEYVYSINPNCYDEDDEETYDSVEVKLTMRINRRPDEDDDDCEDEE